jgi:hypothetical protein
MNKGELSMKCRGCAVETKTGHLPRGCRLLRFIIHRSAFCLPCLAFCLAAWGQSYSIDWSTVDGGGGTSTGGVYTVSGTIGQPDAGVMSGGTYTLNGGFWGVVAAVQMPGAPWLTVARTATNSVIVSWPLSGDGWVLEWTNRIARLTTPWPQVTLPCQTNGVQAWVIDPAPPGNRFYRLHKP